MPLRTTGRGRTNGIYLLTNYVQTDKFCMELMLIRQGPTKYEFLCTSANYVLSRVVLTENHLYGLARNRPEWIQSVTVSDAIAESENNPSCVLDYVCQECTLRFGVDW